MPFDITLGQARVIEISDPVSVKAEELAQHNIKRGERILLKTRNSPKFWQADAISMDYVFITREAPGFLAGAGVKLVGVDALSVGSPEDPDKSEPDTHSDIIGKRDLDHRRAKSDRRRPRKLQPDLSAAQTEGDRRVAGAGNNKQTLNSKY